ncbi:MAG: signal peptide peptidase SppA [Kiritimatiellia bacterium]
MSKVVYRRSRRPGCLTIVLALIAIGLLLLWLFDRYDGQFLPAARLATRDTRQFGEDEFPTLNEIWSEGDGETKIVRIPLYGMILLGSEPGLFGGISSTDLALRSIRRATLDQDVQALILEIDSGGGGITASDILYHELLRFKQAQPGRKIVVICGDVAASGAYYIALAADKIIAHPTTITGSLGVIIQTLNIRELARQFGIRDVTIKSGDNKDLLNPFSEVSAEQLALLQHVVDDMHNRFKGLIEASRGLDTTTVEGLADGRIFTAAQALEHGLIDGIGYWADAVALTQELLDTQDSIVFRYEPGFSWRQILRASTRLNPRAWFEAMQAPRLLYQWRMD